MLGSLQVFAGTGHSLRGIDGNHLATLLDDDHVLGDLRKIFRDGLGLFDLLQTFFSRALSISRHNLHLGLNFVDDLLNSTSALFADLSQISHLVSDDGEALAVFSGSRGFDGCV